MVHTSYENIRKLNSSVFSRKHMLQFDGMHSSDVYVYLNLLTRLPGIDIDGLSLFENPTQ